MSCYSGRNYHAPLRICGYIDALDCHIDARGECGRWTTHVYKRVSNILFIKILEVRQIQNPLSLDSSKLCMSHGASAHVG